MMKNKWKSLSIISIVGMLTLVAIIYVFRINKDKVVDISVIKNTNELNSYLEGDMLDGTKVIVDLRDSTDYEYSHIEGTINIPYQEDEQLLLQAFKEQDLKDKGLFLLCYSGVRSAKTFNLLINKGYRNIHYIAFGYEDYIKGVENGKSIKRETYLLASEEEFPNINFYDNQDNEYSITNFTSEYKMVVYLSNECASCINSLNVLEQIKGIWNSDNFELIILWDDEIPVNLTDKLDMTDGTSYSLRGHYALAKATPAAYILHNNKVVFFDSGVLKNSIMKLMDMSILDLQQLKLNVDSYIEEKVEIDKKDMLLLFSSSNCDSCKELEKTINENSLQQYHIVRIMDQDNNNTEDKNILIDYGNILEKLYEVTIYPTMISFDGQGQRETYNEGNLVEAILQRKR